VGAQKSKKIHPGLHVISHPLINHKLTLMRDHSCPMPQFRALMKEIGMLMAYEITRDWPVATRPVQVPDPLSYAPSDPFEAPILDPQFKPVIVPMLRAGLPLAEGIMTVLPDLPVGHIGVQRGREDHDLVEYLIALPAPQGRTFILVDPVIGTGIAALQTIEALSEFGISEEAVRFVTVLISPEGAASLAQKSKVRIYAAALEDYLDDEKYVRPGFGNAMDRLYG
jgi:uracil phosphoribosyltransferase